ncbi:hypothetical protein NB706_002588 [Xanthomonas sacchari]|nr:hypothetical protein [Xanthomonas sacchari]
MVPVPSARPMVRLRMPGSLFSVAAEAKPLASPSTMLTEGSYGSKRIDAVLRLLRVDEPQSILLARSTSTPLPVSRLTGTLPNTMLPLV